MEPCSKPILVVLVGPTGVGKSDVAVALAERWECPIINADSRQVYREIPIGTAAPTEQQLQRVKHYCVATKNLNEDYNAGQFERDAIELLTQQKQETRNNARRAKRETTPDGLILAILTGGSMLYIDAVCNGLDDIPTVPEEIRQEVRKQYQEQGLAWLQQEVQRLDPAYWETVDQANPQRLMHCVEVSQTIGRPYSTCRKNQPKEREWRIVKIGLNRPRAELYDRINQRVDAMIAAGLEQEARAAFAQYPDRPNGLQTVGYREWAEAQDTRQIIEQIKQNTRHYAKRQMTWWNRDHSIHWFTHEQTELSVRAIDAYVHQLQESNH